MKSLVPGDGEHVVQGMVVRLCWGTVVAYQVLVRNTKGEQARDHGDRPARLPPGGSF
jgi:hypothetical protein